MSSSVVASPPCWATRPIGQSTPMEELPPDETCWTVIRGAASGNARDQSAFSRKYLPVVRAYLVARWQDAALEQSLEDAIQDVFIECFRAEGVLEKVDQDRPGGFRAFLFGVVRNIALRTEHSHLGRQARKSPDSFHPELAAAREATLSKVFDRAWAKSVMEQAVALQRQKALGLGEAALQRVELLKLRFMEGVPIREIAARWHMDPSDVHVAYRGARKDFRNCLRQIVAFHSPRKGSNLDGECLRLLSLLE